jgi:hypothetical protein
MALVLLRVTQPLSRNGGFSGSQILAVGKYAKYILLIEI